MTMHTIERIYPKDLNPLNPDDQASLQIHMQRYEFAALHLSGQRVLDMACGCGYGTALLAERNPDKQVTALIASSAWKPSSICRVRTCCWPTMRVY